MNIVQEHFVLQLRGVILDQDEHESSISSQSKHSQKTVELDKFEGGGSHRKVLG